jgi:hypothetical protein
MITLFGVFYFSIKYVIDKYNLTVIYPKTLEGRGDISTNIYYLANLTIFFQQAIMFGLFTITLNRQNLTLSLAIFFIFQIIIRYLFANLNFDRIREYYKSIGNYMSEEDEHKIAYEEGTLDKEDRKNYESVILEGINPNNKIEDVQYSSESSEDLSETSSNSEKSKKKNLIHTWDEKEIILQEYFHPVYKFI